MARAEEMRDAKGYVTKKLGHLKSSDPLAPPDGRSTDELDMLIEGIIGAFPAANRLYPDLYAWVITDAIREHLDVTPNK